MKRIAAIVMMAAVAATLLAADFFQEREWREQVKDCQAQRAYILSAAQNIVAHGDRLTATRAAWVAQRDDPATSAADKARLVASIAKLDALTVNIPPLYIAAKAYRDVEQ